MKILAIETATLMGGVALTTQEGLQAEYRLNVQSTHSEQLMPSVDKVLKASNISLQEIDGFAVSIGPGSFTGLRIGISTVKGFAIVTGRPILPVSTLEALAYGLPFSTHPICPLLDARKGEVYTALFQFKGTKNIQRLWDDQVMIPSVLLSRITQPTLFLGNGIHLLNEALLNALGNLAILTPMHLWVPSALHIAELAREKWNRGQIDPSLPIIPRYIRRSEAEIKSEKRQQEEKTQGRTSLMPWGKSMLLWYV